MEEVETQPRSSLGEDLSVSEAQHLIQCGFTIFDGPDSSIPSTRDTAPEYVVHTVHGPRDERWFHNRIDQLPIIHPCKLRNIVLKLDADVFELSPLLLRLPPGSEFTRISAAYSQPAFTCTVNAVA